MNAALPGLCPGTIETFDAETHECTVSITGLTLPDEPMKALYPIAGLPLLTSGAHVWLMFEGGDPRFPIVMGLRTPARNVTWRSMSADSAEATT